jgi:hypothetical protein
MVDAAELGIEGVSSGVAWLDKADSVGVRALSSGLTQIYFIAVVPH